MKKVTISGIFLSSCLFVCVSSPIVAQQAAPKKAATPMHSTRSIYDAVANHYDEGTPPEYDALVDKAVSLTKAGEAALEAGAFTVAEAKFRAAISIHRVGGSDEGLAESLMAQGRPEEAVPVYQNLIAPSGDWSNLDAATTDTLMGYAIALSQIGQWREAVAIYEKALPKTSNFGDAPKINVHFDPDMPMSRQLQALAHIAIGIEYTGHGENAKAFREFGKGESLASDSAFANYYYGYGWQKLSPAERAQFGTAQQAKAALQKAVKFGKGDVKGAAQKALQVAMNTK